MSALAILVLALSFPKEMRGDPTCPYRTPERRELTKNDCKVVLSGADWFGGDLKSSAIEGLGSAAECCRECRAESDCVAYIYRIDFDHCHLKGTINDPSPCDMCEGLNLLEPVPPPDCNALSEQDMPGGNIPGMPLITGDPGWCCNQCQNTDECVAWSWHRDSNCCFLKNEQNAMVQCSACVTGELNKQTPHEGL